MRPDLDTEFFDSPRPRVIAHRGASGVFPENTLLAFDGARECGAAYIELDIHMTRDGELVVAHDADLRRIAGRDGAIAEMTREELNAADAAYNFSLDGTDAFPFRGKGVRIPSLAEVLAAFPQERFVIEIKPSTRGLVAPMLEVIEHARMRRRVLIASEHQEPIDELRTLAPHMPTNFARGDVAAFLASLPAGAVSYAPRGDALQLPPEHMSWKLVTAESVAAAHRIGAEVHVWTVNEEAEMRAFLALGVDGIITDYPARLIGLLSS
jgi:glycerophosphoryl diester phosphodiesterase